MFFFFGWTHNLTRKWSGKESIIGEMKTERNWNGHLCLPMPRTSITELQNKSIIVCFFPLRLFKSTWPEQNLCTFLWVEIDPLSKNSSKIILASSVFNKGIMASVNHLPLFFLCTSNPTVWWSFPGFYEVLKLNWSVCISLVHLFLFIKTGTILTRLHFHSISPVLQKFLKLVVLRSHLPAPFSTLGSNSSSSNNLNSFWSTRCCPTTSWLILTCICLFSALPLHGVLLSDRISFSCLLQTRN